jgi:hypothetical protein
VDDIGPLRNLPGPNILEKAVDLELADGSLVDELIHQGPSVLWTELLPLVGSWPPSMGSGERRKEQVLEILAILNDLHRNPDSHVVRGIGVDFPRLDVREKAVSRHRHAEGSFHFDNRSERLPEKLQHGFHGFREGNCIVGGVHFENDPRNLAAPDWRESRVGIPFFYPLAGLRRIG